jgi:hypothetical protein
MNVKNDERHLVVPRSQTPTLASNTTTCVLSKPFLASPEVAQIAHAVIIATTATKKQHDHGRSIIIFIFIIIRLIFIIIIFIIIIFIFIIIIFIFIIIISFLSSFVSARIFRRHGRRIWIYHILLGQLQQTANRKILSHVSRV